MRDAAAVFQILECGAPPGKPFPYYILLSRSPVAEDVGCTNKRDIKFAFGARSHQFGQPIERQRRSDAPEEIVEVFNLLGHLKEYTHCVWGLGTFRLQHVGQVQKGMRFPS